MRFVVDLSSVTLGDVEKLTRIPLALLGRWVKGAQKFAITRETVKKLAENFRKRATGDVVIDYEHASEFPGLAQGQPVPAAGWLKQIEDTPDEKGVLWGLAELTQRAREMIERREYKYISPAINWGERDKVSGEPQGATLTSVALVNRPFLESMPAVQLSEAGWQILEEEKEMKAKNVTLAEGGNQAVVTCGEGEEKITVEFDFEEAGLTRKPQVIALADVKRTSDGKLDFASIEAGDKLVAGEVFRAMRVEAELDLAIGAGKILPAQRTHYEKLALSDLAGFRELVKSMKPQVDLGEHGLAGGGEGEKSERAKVERQIGDKVKERMKEDKDLTYGQALKLVAREEPDLDKRRTQLLREGK